MVSKAVSSEFFMVLKSELDHAYGFGFKPDQGKIAEIVDEALQLTSISDDVTQEEYDFYQSLSKKVSPTTEGLEDLREKIEAVKAAVIHFEETSKDMGKQFLSKNASQQWDYLASYNYSEIVRTANEDSTKIREIAEQIQDLLFKLETGSKANPFKDFASFAQHRKTVSELYNTVASLGNRHAKAMQEITSDTLYGKVTLRSKVTRVVSNYPHFFSIPAGFAIAAAGEFGIQAPFSAITYGLGTFIAAVPWIYNNLKK